MSGDKLKLSDAQGSNPKGNSALEPGNEGSKLERLVLAELKKREKELEKGVIDLLEEDAAKNRHELAKKKAPPPKPAQAKTRHVAHAKGWKAICTAPDFCRVGKAIVGFDSVATLDNKQKASSNVKARGTPVYRKGDIFKTVQGDAGRHIESGTSLGKGYVQILDGHDNVKVNNIPVARHDSRCKINCDASGKGGAMGKLITEQKTVGPGNASVASNPKAPPGERTSTKLEMLKKMKAQIESEQLNLDALDEYVDFKDGNVVLDEVIGSISGAPGSPGDYSAQAARGFLGFVKDIVMGVSELAYEGVKAVPKLARRNVTESGILQTLIGAQIFAEEIALGNFDGQGLGKAALELGRAVLKPVTDPWAKGQYVEASVRAIAEIGTVGAGSIKGGKALKPAAATKTGATAKAAESIRLANAKKASETKVASDSIIDMVDDGVHVSNSGRPPTKRIKTERVFKHGEDLIHFEKHGAEISQTLGYENYSLSQYVQDANHVIANGTYVPELNAYVSIAGGTGSAKGLMVGLDRLTGEITTLHMKPVSWFSIKAPSLGWEVQLKRSLINTVGPDPKSGWQWPY